jgi:CheY-like chemotaxis protein
MIARLALVIEDDPDDRTEITNGLISSGFAVIQASDSSEAQNSLDNLPAADLIVLDWFIEGSGPGDVPAQKLVEYILRNCFAPIAILTSDVVHAADNVPSELPAAFFKVFGKFELETVLGTIDEWSQKKEFHLAREVAKTNNKAVGRVAWELVRSGETGIAGWLSAIDDVQGFLEMFLRFTARELQLEGGVLERFEEEIKAIDSKGKATVQLLLRMLSMDRYYVPSKLSPPMCGDVYRLSDGSFAIMVNPACDLMTGHGRIRRAAQACLLTASTFSKFVSETKIPDTSREKLVKYFVSLLKNQDTTGTGLARVYSMPLVPTGTKDPYSDFVDLVVHLDKVLVIDWGEFDEKLPESRRIVRLDSPYLEALLRQYSLFANRIGLRDIPDDVLENRAKLVLPPVK